MWDFQEILGIDVIEFFTDERGWVEFYAYLGEFPPHSKFNSAISQDPDLAKAQVDSMSDEDIRRIMDKQKDAEDEDPHLNPEGYTIEVEKLNQVIEEVRLLRLGMAGGKNAKFKPPPRPKTEQEILLAKRIESLEEIDKEDMLSGMGF